MEQQTGEAAKGMQRPTRVPRVHETPWENVEMGNALIFVAKKQWRHGTQQTDCGSSNAIGPLRAAQGMV